MNFSFLVYSAIVALSSIDQETLPQRCVSLKINKNILEYAEHLTGYHDEKGDTYHELLTKKSKLMDCDNKNGASDKYLRRNANYKHNHRTHINTRLHNAHCPELNKFLEEHADNEEYCDAAPDSISARLLADIKKEADKLECQYKLPTDFE